jgi:N-acetyl-1-D-myo-inositol-2-amino-2-deoxy-alpha-D-glucopyranoside deacetylase
MTRRLAGVFAHPDDDAFGIAGTCALHADDLELLVIFATNGDAGRIADAALANRETLGQVREAEAASAYRVLGVRADLRFLGYHDGRVAEVPRRELVDRFADALGPFRPQVVITFGPEGITAHQDHIAVGLAATEAFGVVRERLGRARPKRLLNLALANGDLERLAEELRRRGLEPPDPTEPFQPRGVPDERIGVRVDCSSVVKRKLDALREHRTQAQDLEEFPQDLWPEFLSRETFTIAWPERDVVADPLGDVFEGLPAS